MPHSGFNPRLTSAARRTISRDVPAPPTKFQSAPHFSSEANLQVSEPKGRLPMFQSAPHFSSEANSEHFRCFLLGEQVSIRASLQQRGELSVATRSRQTIAFQSAPHFSSEANPQLTNR